MTRRKKKLNAQHPQPTLRTHADDDGPSSVPEQRRPGSSSLPPIVASYGNRVLPLPYAAPSQNHGVSMAQGQQQPPDDDVIPRSCTAQATAIEPVLPLSSQQDNGPATQGQHPQHAQHQQTAEACPSSSGAPDQGPKVCTSLPAAAVRSPAPQAAAVEVRPGATVLRLGTWNTETLRLVPEQQQQVAENGAQQQLQQQQQQQQQQQNKKKKKKKKNQNQAQAPNEQQRSEQLEKLRHIASTIVAERMDLVALQEVTYSWHGEAALHELVKLLDAAEAAAGAPGSSWAFIAHFDEAIKGNEFGGEMFAFLYKQTCGEHNRRICSATPSCHVLGPSDRKEYVGENFLLQRTPAFARFFIHEGLPAEGLGPVTPQPPDQAPPHGPRTYSIILMSIHAKAPNGRQMGGNARDLQALGKLAKAIRLPNDASIRGSTPVVMLGDFNLDCANTAVFARVLNKGWLPALAPGVTTNVKCERQFDNIWVQCRGGERGAGQDHGLVEFEAAAVVPKPAEVPRVAYSDHCLVHCRVHLLRQLSPAAAAAAAAAPGGQAFLAPSLAAAYKGSLAAKMSQVVMPGLVQRMRKVPRLGGGFGALPCFGRRLHLCVCVEEEEVREAVEATSHRGE